MSFSFFLHATESSGNPVVLNTDSHSYTRCCHGARYADNKHPGNPSYVLNLSISKACQQMLFDSRVDILYFVLQRTTGCSVTGRFSRQLLTFCSHWVLFSMAFSRLSSFLSCQEGLSFWALPFPDWLVSDSLSGGESLWRVLVTWKSFTGRQCSTSGRMKV